MVTKKLDAFGKKMDFGPKNCIFGPKFCIFLRYTYETPIFSARTVPTQWDHKSPISWGNSGYLQFSGRWPFGRLAGRFVAPIAQSGPFGVHKCCFLARNQFFCGQPQTFEGASTNLVDFLDKQIIILVCSWLRLAGNASQGVSIYFIYFLCLFVSNSKDWWTDNIMQIG